MADSIPEGPIEDEPESHAERFFSTLRMWGMVEFHLDMCLVSIRERHETRQPPPPFPATLERKLQYLADACASLTALADAADQAAIVDRVFSAHKGLRNDIVHGSPLDYEDDGTVHFMLLRRRKGAAPNYVLRTVRPKDWDALFTASAKLTFELLILRLLIDPPPDGVFDLAGERLREWEIKSAASFPGSKRLRDLLVKLVSRRP